MHLLTSLCQAFRLTQRVTRRTCYAVACGLRSLPYWTCTAAYSLCSTGLRGLFFGLARIAALAWLFAEACYATIVAVARTPHCLPARLLARGPPPIPPRPAPLLYGGTTEPEVSDFGPTSSKAEARSTATRPIMEDTALRRYGAVLARQGEIFNGVPLENRGEGNCLFLSLAHGARELGLLANVTGASLRTMIVEFVVNQSARMIGTTTLGTAVHDQFGLSVSDYAEKMAQDGAWGCFTEIAAFALKLVRVPSGCNRNRGRGPRTVT